MPAAANRVRQPAFFLTWRHELALRSWSVWRLPHLPSLGCDRSGKVPHLTSRAGVSLSCVNGPRLLRRRGSPADTAGSLESRRLVVPAQSDAGANTKANCEAVPARQVEVHDICHGPRRATLWREAGRRPLTRPALERWLCGAVCKTGWLIVLLPMVAITLVLPYLPLVAVLGFAPLPPAVLATVLVIAALYIAATEAAKRHYHRFFA